MATRNQTRPSCAKVKIEVDMIAKLPQRVRINKENDDTGEIKSKWIKIQYDYMPKYCKECCLQGHDEATCWTIHPELFEAKKEEDNKETLNEEGKEAEGKNSNSNRRQYERGMNHFQKQEWMARKNKYKKDRYGHIEGEWSIRMKILLKP